MCLLKAYLNDGSHFVVVILWPAFAARAELDHFAKRILCGSFGNRRWIMKVSKRVGRACITYLGVIWRSTRHSWPG